MTTFSLLEASEFGVLTIWRGVTTPSTRICVPFCSLTEKDLESEDKMKEQKKSVRTVIFLPNVLTLPFMSLALTLSPNFVFKDTKTMRMVIHTSTACHCCTVVVGLFEFLLNISLNI